jgi:hypothetical protein
MTARIDDIGVKTPISFTLKQITFIRWHQFSWFLKHALIHGFLNSWFQTLQATINEKVVFRWILIFVV